MEIKEFTRSYINDVIVALNNIDTNFLNDTVRLLKAVKESNKKVLMLGNGGSSANPSHSAGDWSKELGIKTFCLSDNTPFVTALANDTSYENIFKGQLEVYMDEGDLIFAYSGSGNSPNVIKAVEYAQSKGNTVVGITGNYKSLAGGKLATIADFSHVIHTESMEVIEDLQLVINHILKEYLKLS